VLPLESRDKSVTSRGNTQTCVLPQKLVAEHAKRAARKSLSVKFTNIFTIAENIFTGKLFDDVDSVDLQYTGESIIMKDGHV
jgi:hypothetical protein